MDQSSRNLTHAFRWQYSNLLWNASTKNDSGINQYCFLVPKISWLPYQCPLRDCQMNARLIIPIHVSTITENLVKIGLADSGIFGGYANFRLFPKS